jgi:flavin-dependent thymidylate synthase
MPLQRRGGQSGDAILNSESKLVRCPRKSPGSPPVRCPRKSPGLKKEDARFVLPNACVSEIVVSADLREWRHIFQLRLSPKAQWEIRRACELMLALLRQHAPTCFEDF